MVNAHAHSPPTRVALIGFGEAGEAFVRAGKWCASASAWDVLEDRRAAMRGCGIEPAADAHGRADIVLSLVTADAAVLAARAYAPTLRKGAMWCDMNSVAPATKRAAATAIQSAGGRYADVAVMAPVDAGLAVPLLVSGPEAREARAMLAALGFSNLRVVGEEIGRASAIKLLRSVMVKGIEALSFECARAAEAAAVLEEVAAALDASERDWPWARRIAYNRQRMAAHGERRAAEMEETCAMLAELGIEPVMSRATARRQREAAGRAPARGVAGT